jgi:lysophospholipase L1-like esterase
MSNLAPTLLKQTPGGKLFAGKTSNLYPSVMTTPPTITSGGPGGASPISGAVLIPYNTPLVSLLGSSPVLVQQYGSNYYGNGCNGGWTRPNYAVEFDYCGSEFCLAYRSMNGSPGFWINGAPATSAASDLTGQAAGSYYRLIVNFGSTAWRRVRIYTSYADFGGVEVSPTDTIIPVPRNYSKIAFYGDSYTEGTTQQYDQIQGFAMMAGALTGAETFRCGQGGTGYTTAGANGIYGAAAYSDPTRLANLASTNADIVHVLGSFNDSSAATTALTSAALTTLSTIKSSMPNAKLYVWGVQTIGNTVLAQNALNNTALASVCSSLGLPFVDMINGGWITGTGTTASPAGNGNADVLVGADGVHPSGAGFEHIARRMATYDLLNVA